MKYQDLLYEYENTLTFINRQRGFHSTDYAKGMYRMMRMFMRSEFFKCEDLPVIDHTNNTFSYRGTEYKVEVDDYGQQLYIDLGNDRTISGGSFNSCPELEWIDQLNDIIDVEIYPWLNE